MNIQQLEYIVALDKHRHFQRAAEACGVSQPTLSALVQKLEEEIIKIVKKKLSDNSFIRSTIKYLESNEQAILDVKEIVVFGSIIVGSCLGFLIFNLTTPLGFLE